MKTYSEKLRDPRWQKMRLQILERDSWTCIGCYDDESTLHVHHKSYKSGKEPWEYDQTNFMTLCENCHLEEKNSRLESEKLIIHALKSQDFTYSDVHEIACNFGNMKFTHVKDVVVSVLGLFLRSGSFQEKVIELYFEEISSKKK